jgi:hypothetical protein
MCGLELVERQIMTEDEVTALFAKAAEEHGLFRSTSERRSQRTARLDSEGEGAQIPIGACGLL